MNAEASSQSSVACCADRKAMIVEDQTLVGMGMNAHLQAIGYQVVGQASNAAEALAMFREHRPDVVLMDIKLDGDDGIELSRQLLAERRCAIVMVSAYSDPELIARAGAVGVFGYLIKPVAREALAAQVEIAVNRCREQEQLIQENQSLTQTLEARKLVERAKGILMKRLNLDEPSAHRRLQMESQKRRISLAEIAKKVIESEKLLGD
ncbi:MAG TPA: response regulator [Tepidisphaeraceae bacterium]|jgi:response regulator NasT|nr:response regulator [Tepidisphaeraceae bacterium]